MNRNLYIVTAGAVQQHVIATDSGAALAHLVDTNTTFRTSPIVQVRHVDDLIDLTTKAAPAPASVPAERSNTPPRAVSKAAVKGPRKSKETTKPAIPSASGGMTNAEAAAAIGCNLKGIANLKYRKVLVTAGFGCVTKASVDAHLAGLSATKKHVVRELKDMLNAPWEPNPQPTDTLKHIDKVAAEVGMNTDQVAEVKRNGRVPGGNGWVNLTVLKAYMAHKDYEPPFAADTVDQD